MFANSVLRTSRVVTLAGQVVQWVRSVAVQSQRSEGNPRNIPKGERRGNSSKLSSDLYMYVLAYALPPYKCACAHNTHTQTNSTTINNNHNK